MSKKIQRRGSMLGGFLPGNANYASDDDDDDDDDLVDGQEHQPTTVDEIKDLNKLVCFETNSLRCWRLVVVLFLLGTGAVLATFSYRFLKDEESEGFERTYELFSERTRARSQEYINNLILAFDEMSTYVSSAAEKSPTDFPFVTVPYFEVAGYQARVVSGIQIFAYTPIITASNVDEWNEYSVQNRGWLQESRDYIRNLPPREDGTVVLGIGEEEGTEITPYIWREDALQNPVVAYPPPHAPVWHVSPPVASGFIVNFDMLKEPIFGAAFEATLIVRDPVITEFVQMENYAGSFINRDAHAAYFEEAFGNVNSNRSSFDHPHSVMIQPVYKSVGDRNSPIVGIFLCSLAWDRLIRNLVTDGSIGIFAVLSNSCGQSYTYRLQKDFAEFLGKGDLHDDSWNHKRVEVSLSSFLSNNTVFEDGHCRYTLSIYPSNTVREEWESNTPNNFAYAVAIIFFSVTVIFFIYDGFVRRRNKVIVKAAARSNKIVASLFPSNVRDRLLAEDGLQKQPAVEHGTQTRLKNFLENDTPSAVDMEEGDDLMFKTKPIADLFPETTILFADIAGFTAWSSAREPSQVFTLLETIYRAFDVSAQRRRIFKVETIGDCYVAATGLPEPRRDHAVAMARFARECLGKMQALTRRLEVSLGPDTADLAMRMGMHSGPVTAGVLRGERSRFQLFGDTMNTASRMESTGVRDRIQISQETADLLLAAGKGSWIVPRDDTVVAKGKGEMTTFFLEVGSHDNASISSGSSDDESVAELEFQANNPEIADEQEIVFSEKALRLIDWNVDLLLRLLHQIVARRQIQPNTGAPPDESVAQTPGATVLDEVTEIVVLPEFDHSIAGEESGNVVLDPKVELELYEYVTAVAAMYRKNPFHNFEHASHVTMSVAKLMARIVAPSNMDFEDSAARNQTLHDHTYGITSDPLTQFACVLSALIHDVDHTGVPNTQLVEENEKMATYYKGRSVAEQNSVDVAWDLLMQEEFSSLRSTIYNTDDDYRRFRQLVVNSVMATDIMDKELKALRNARWDRAFSEAARVADDDPRATINRKATIVIEHLIQASDVSHTMQHWHIYRKWNAKLFEEMYKAYKEGRAEKNPADFWYKGEIGFFDFYIIPLAKKLKECGVFGVSSKEYLNYAERNRKEWEMRGQEVVSELIENVNKIYKPPEAPAAITGPSAIPTNITIDGPPIN